MMKFMDNLRKSFLVKGNSIVGAVGDKYFSTSPIGVIQAFSGTTIPHGYLLADGTSYKVADYPDLYTVIGNTYGGDTENFNVPDYRETVLVGVGENTTDTIASHDVYGLGEFKDDQLQGHSHNVLGLGGQFAGLSSGRQCVEQLSSYTAATQNVISDGTNGTPRIGTTTHGKQKGVTYIIKAFHTNEGVDSGVSDDVINYVNNSNSYSTEETLTGGKWIDGKPVYRKVYKVTNITTNLDLSELNIADIITINGSLKQTDESVTAFPYLPNEQIVYDKYLKSGYYKSKTKEWIWQFGSIATTDFSSGIFIIEYTKTTD